MVRSAYRRKKRLKERRTIVLAKLLFLEGSIYSSSILGYVHNKMFNLKSPFAPFQLPLYDEKEKRMYKMH